MVLIYTKNSKEVLHLHCSKASREHLVRYLALVANKIDMEASSL